MATETPIDPQVASHAYKAITGALHELAHNGEILTYPREPQPVAIEYNDANHRYKIDGAFVPSVTTVLDETEPKPALTWWGFRVGLAGVVRALAEDRITYATLQAHSWEPIIKPGDHEGHPDIVVNPKTGKLRSRLEETMLDRRLRHHPNAIKDDKGTIGTSVHVAAETLGLTGEIPDIGDFPEADRGYVQALARYWMAEEPEVEHSEVIVGSRRFGFAGRFDKIVRTRHGLVLRDYKTSGGVYASFDTQLSGYDVGWREMGGEPLVGHEVVWLQPSGDWAVIPVTINHGDFLTALLRLLQIRDQRARIKALGRTP